jgi:hypothetical protein
MNPGSASEVVRLAEDTQASIVDRWGSSRVVVAAGNIDRDRWERISDMAGYSVVARFGGEAIEVRLSQVAADATELQSLASTEAEVVALRQATSLDQVMEIVGDDLSEVEVAYQQPCWCRTVEALHTAVRSDWASVVEAADCGSVIVGDERVDLVDVPVAGARANALPVREPVLPTTAAEPGPAWQLWASLAEGAAWTQLAFRVERRGKAVRAALHSDQPPDVVVEPTAPAGAVELLRWLDQDSDPNRSESLRYVLRLTTASGSPSLPNPATVKSLAERQRIALARDRAAEVQRAITDGQKGTEEALEAVSGDLSSMVEDSVKTTGTLVVAVLGLITLLFRTDGDLPDHVVVLAAVAVVLGVVVTAFVRHGRISDIGGAVSRHQSRLSTDPLLPEDDRARAEQDIAGFSLRARLIKARLAVWGLALLAVVVACAGSGWVLTTEASRTTSSDGSTTTTPSVTVSTTTRPVPTSVTTTPPTTTPRPTTTAPGP